MADTNQTDAGLISGNVLFYSKPEPLSKELHAKLGLRRIDRPYAFAAGSQVAPLTVTEFPAAALSFPIIFAGERYQPLAVMGVNADANMFIEPTGGFEAGVYIPAYIRRYPFVLANDPKGEQLVVCIDRAAPMLGDLPDLAFFDAAGEPTEYTKNCMQFCNDFEVEVRRTDSFITLLKDLDLFETRTQTYTPANPDGTPGAPQTVAEYFCISETRLKALPAEKIQELLTNGAIGQIYAHLTSLLGWDRLIALAIARQAAAPKAANLN
ncbi:MAG: SapC family protein [Caulobacteraceae bacterium]